MSTSEPSTPGPRAATVIERELRALLPVALRVSSTEGETRDMTTERLVRVIMRVVAGKLTDDDASGAAVARIRRVLGTGRNADGSAFMINAVQVVDLLDPEGNWSCSFVTPQ